MYKKAVLLFVVFFTGIRAFALIARFFIPNPHHNYGIAFAVPVHAIAIYILMGSAMIGVLVVLHRLNFRYYIAPGMLILAGGASNALDRIVYSSVIDPITIFNWQGNGADIALLVGIIWVGWSMIKPRNVISTNASTH